MIPPRPSTVALSFALAALVSTVCHVGDAACAAITGTATYRERVALSASSVFEATLEDVSRADARAEIIGTTRKSNPGQVPIAFEIRYDERRILPGHTYVVRATIHEGGRLRFASSQGYQVLTPGHSGRVAILMRAASSAREDRGPTRAPAPALGPLPATFAGLVPCADCVGIRHQINLLPNGAYMQRTTHLRDGSDQSFYEIGAWSLSNDGRTLTLDDGRSPTRWAVRSKDVIRALDVSGNRANDSNRSYDLTRASNPEPMQPRARLVGMFRSMADAASFRDCRSGLRWPVEMSGDYLDLERSYTARRMAPGADLKVSIDGRIEERPRMEGRGVEPTLIVEKFVSATPGEDCAGGGAEPQGGLANHRWRPLQIDGRTVTVSGQQREPWIVLDPRANRVTGSGGCNRISGRYETDGDALRFGPLISTKMACSDMEIETSFLRALDETRRYRLRGRVLELLDERGRVLARLEERTLR